MSFTNSGDIFLPLRADNAAVSLADLRSFVRKNTVTPRSKRPLVLVCGGLAVAMVLVVRFIGSAPLGRRFITSSSAQHILMPSQEQGVDPISNLDAIASSSLKLGAGVLPKFRSHVKPISGSNRNWIQTSTRAQDTGVPSVGIGDPSSKLNGQSSNIRATNAPAKNRDIVDQNARAGESDSASTAAFSRQMAAAVVDHHSTALTPSRFQFSAGLQAGIVMSSLNTTGGGYTGRGSP